MKKKLLKSILAFILLVSIFFFLDLPLQNPPPLDEIGPSLGQNVSIKIDFGESELIEFSAVQKEGETAYSLLQKASTEKGINLVTTQYDFGVFVEQIGEAASSAEMAWIYFINGESGQVASDQAILSPGDLVEWKYLAPDHEE